MQIRFTTRRQALHFAAGVTVLCLIGNAILQWVLIPPFLLRFVLLTSSCVTVILALPAAYFVGKTLLEVHLLTITLEDAANHDRLTGASTRAGFYQQIEEDGLFPCAVIVADIDFFKKFNDRYGHRGGDLALKHFAKTLLSNCRDVDIVARFGGEEFVVLLRETNLETGLGVASRLCDRVRSQGLRLGDRVLHVTASFGVAVAGHKTQIDRAIHQADLALYRAKRTGRNRALGYDPALDVEPVHDPGDLNPAQAVPISRASNG